MKITNIETVTSSDLPEELYSFLKENDALYEYLHEINKTGYTKKDIPFLKSKGNHIWAAFEFYNSRKGLPYWGNLASKYDRL